MNRDDAMDRLANRIATFLLADATDTPSSATPEFSDTQVKRFLAAYYRHQIYKYLARLQNLDYCDTLPLESHMAGFYAKAAAHQGGCQDPLTQTFNFVEPLVDAPWVDWANVEEW